MPSARQALPQSISAQKIREKQYICASFSREAALQLQLTHNKVLTRKPRNQNNNESTKQIGTAHARQLTTQQALPRSAILTLIFWSLADSSRLTSRSFAELEVFQSLPLLVDAWLLISNNCTGKGQVLPGIAPLTVDNESGRLVYTGKGHGPNHQWSRGAHFNHPQFFLETFLCPNPPPTYF